MLGSVEKLKGDPRPPLFARQKRETAETVEAWTAQRSEASCSSQFEAQRQASGRNQAQVKRWAEMAVSAHDAGKNEAMLAGIAPDPGPGSGGQAQAWARAPGV